MFCLNFETFGRVLGREDEVIRYGVVRAERGNGRGDGRTRGIAEKRGGRDEGVPKFGSMLKEGILRERDPLDSVERQFWLRITESVVKHSTGTWRGVSVEGL